VIGETLVWPKVIAMMNKNTLVTNQICMIQKPFPKSDNHPFTQRPQLRGGHLQRAQRKFQ